MMSSSSDNKKKSISSIKLVGEGQSDSIKKSQLETLSYSKIGRNDKIAAEPSAVHFAGFQQLGKTLVTKLRILNVSSTATRIHIFFPPSDSVFSASCNKKGTIHPGMSETITVRFTPSSFQYYYDSIRIHNEAGNLLIPIHAYPVLNKINFPRNFNFGSQPINTVVQRRITMQCSVPIEFQFRISVTKSNEAFSISPLSGVISGETSIVVTFRPSIFATVTAEIQLELAQFNFKPLTCLITGSCTPGDSTISTSTAEVLTLPSSSNTNQEEKTERPHHRRRIPKGSTMISSPSPRMEEEVVEGLKIPKYIDGIASTNFILTQTPGKLKPKDLKKAITEQRSLRKAQKEEQAALRGNSSSTTTLTLSSIVAEEVKEKSNSRQLCELAFLQDVQEIEQAEKDLEFQSQKIHLGSGILTDVEVQYIRDLRKYQQSLVLRTKRDSERHEFESKGFNTLSDNPCRSNTTVGYVPKGIKPTYSTYKNNLWGKRKRVISKFIQAVSTCIVRARAQRRIELIFSRIGSARNSRVEVKKLVVQDWKSAISSSTSNNNTTNDSHDAILKSSSVLGNTLLGPVILPNTDDSEIISDDAFAPVVLGRTDDNSSTTSTFEPFRLKIPQESYLLGYDTIPYPSMLMYFGIETNRELLTGAQYESGVCAAESSTLVEALPPAVDASVLVSTPNIDPMTLVKPNSELRLFTRPKKFRESDPDFCLQPNIWPRDVPSTAGDVLRESVGTISAVTSLDSDLRISKRWRESRVSEFTTLYTSDVPALHSAPVEELSESESDNEEEDRVNVPTLEDAKLLFTESSSPTTNLFKRYEASIELEKEYNAKREMLQKRLPDRMTEAATWVKEYRHQLVLEGHGHDFPLYDFSVDDTISK